MMGCIYGLIEGNNKYIENAGGKPNGKKVIWKVQETTE
jgi:hypothetical protein